LSELEDPVNPYFMVTDKYSVFEKSEGPGSDRSDFWRLSIEMNQTVRNSSAILDRSRCEK
jgi:hypothetical protein